MGRSKTGRTTKVVRVPLDFDVKKAARLYYDLLPNLEYYHEQSLIHGNSVRYDFLRKTISESDIADML